MYNNLNSNPKRTHNKKKVTLKPMSGIGLNCKSSSMNSSQVGHLIPYWLCLLSCQCCLHPVQPSDCWACGRCLGRLLGLWPSPCKIAAPVPVCQNCMAANSSSVSRVVAPGCFLCAMSLLPDLPSPHSVLAGGGMNPSGILTPR